MKQKLRKDLQLRNTGDTIKVAEYKMIEAVAYEIIESLTVEGILDFPNAFDELMRKCREIDGKTREELKVDSDPYDSSRADKTFWKILKYRIEEEDDPIIQSKLFAVADSLYSAPTGLHSYYISCCLKCSGYFPRNENIALSATKLLCSAKELRSDNAEIIKQEGLNGIEKHLIKEYQTTLFPIKKWWESAPKIEVTTKSFDDARIGTIVIKETSHNADRSLHRRNQSGRTDPSMDTLYVVANGKMKKVHQMNGYFSIDDKIENDKLNFSFNDNRGRRIKYSVYVGTDKNKLFELVQSPF